ncbi:MAG: hypothetical protein AAFR46_09385 [Pseudomonadota bacterium]
MTKIDREELRTLLERARRVTMTPAQEAAQRRSFAFGNASFENPRITKDMIVEAERELEATGER